MLTLSMNLATESKESERYQFPSLGDKDRQFWEYRLTQTYSSSSALALELKPRKAVLSYPESKSLKEF